MSDRKSPAQTLFDRVMRTWIVPAANATAKDADHPIVLRIALIIWDGARSPSVYFNDEVRGKVLKMGFISTGPVKKGQPITPNDIKGIEKITLRHGIHDKPFLFMIQAKDKKFFVASSRMDQVVGNRDFELLEKALGSEGVHLTSQDSTFSVVLDLIRNSYVGFPSALKRRETRQLARLEVERVEKDAVNRVKRHLKLPTLICHQDDEFLPLLLETRQTYADGYYFSCISSGVTTADRICNRLVERYGLPMSEQQSIFQQTFGQKIERLHSRGVITDNLRGPLAAMNKIRKRHLHPKDRLRPLTLKRDALRTVRLLHEVLEQTFSVFRDYTIENGKLIPKPFV